MKYTSELIYNCRILQSEQPFVSLVSILEDEILIVVALQVQMDYLNRVIRQFQFLLEVFILDFLYVGGD